MYPVSNAYDFMQHGMQGGTGAGKRNHRSYARRMQRGFCQASAEILQMFEDRLDAAKK